MRNTVLASSIAHCVPTLQNQKRLFEFIFSNKNSSRRERLRKKALSPWEHIQPELREAQKAQRKILCAFLQKRTLLG